MSNNHTASDFTPTPEQVRDAKIQKFLLSKEGREKLSMALYEQIYARLRDQGRVQLSLPPRQIPGDG